MLKPLLLDVIIDEVVEYKVAIFAISSLVDCCMRGGQRYIILVMKKMINALPVGILSFIVTALIVYLSLDANPLDVGHFKFFEGFDKIVHFVMYWGCGIVYLLDYAKFKYPHHCHLNVELALTAMAMLLGLLMEIMQLLLANGRSFDVLDWVADVAGAVVAFGLMHWLGLHWLRHVFNEVKKQRHLKG